MLAEIASDIPASLTTALNDSADNANAETPTVKE